MIYGQAQADSIANKAMTTGFGNHKSVRIALRPKDSASSADMEASTRDYAKIMASMALPSTV